VTTMPLFDARALAEKSAALEGKAPQDIIAWAMAEYAPKVGISTAFGVEGCALIDMAVKLEPRVQVFTVDTDFLFPETYELMERLTQRYGIVVERVKGKMSKAEQEREHGVALWERDSDLCCGIRKVEPTQRAVAGLDAWFAGLRRDQSATRAGIQLLERYDHEDGSPLVKVNPLAAWTRNDTWKYVLANDVPYNPLLDQGYKSIGCWPCTRPVAAGGDERSGRWAGQGKTECGIHTFMIRKA
jgi:phosphoadenosine phosphosulfate reductase